MGVSLEEKVFVSHTTASLLRLADNSSTYSFLVTCQKKLKRRVFL